MNTTETVSKQASGLQNFLLAMPRAPCTPALVHLATTRNAQALALWRCFCRGELGDRELVSLLTDLAALLGKAELKTSYPTASGPLLQATAGFRMPESGAPPAPPGAEPRPRVGPTMGVVIGLSRAGALSRAEMIALAHALLEGERGVGGRWGPAAAITRVAAELQASSNVFEAVRELKHLATLLGAGSGGPEAHTQQQHAQPTGALIKRRAAAAAPVAAAPAVALSPPLFSPTHLVDLLGSLAQGGFISSADAHALAHGLLIGGQGSGVGEGGDAALLGAVSDAASQWRTTGEFGRFQAEVGRLGAFQRQRMQQQQQQQQQQQHVDPMATAAPLAAAAAPRGGRTDEALLFERTCRTRDEALAASAQAALKAKTAAPPHQAPHLSPGALPPSALVDMVMRLSAGGLLSPSSSKALTAGIPRTPELAASVMCAVGAAARDGNLSTMVAELERLGRIAIASSSAPPQPPSQAASSRPRRTPVALTPFKSLPPDDDDEGDDDDAEEEKEGGGWPGAGAAAEAWRSPSTAPAATSTSKAFLLKVIDVLCEEGLFAVPDAAAVRAAVASDPGGALACGAAQAVGAFNGEGGAGGDVQVLLAALTHACDAHCTASAAPTFLGTQEMAAAAAGRSKGPEAAAAAAESPALSLADLQAVISSLAGAGLIGVQDAVEVRSELNAHDGPATAALITAIGECAAGGGIGPITRCVHCLGGAGKQHHTVSEAGKPMSAAPSHAAVAPAMPAAAAQTAAVNAAATSADALRVLDALAGMCGDGSLSVDRAQALAEEVVQWPAGAAAVAITAALNKCHCPSDIAAFIASMNSLGERAAKSALSSRRMSSLTAKGAVPHTVSWADISPGVAPPVHIDMRGAVAPAPPPTVPFFLRQAAQLQPKTDPTTLEAPPHPLLRFGAGAIGSAAEARLISISDAAVLLGQLQHGPGHLLTLALHAFQETGDIVSLAHDLKTVAVHAVKPGQAPMASESPWVAVSHAPSQWAAYQAGAATATHQVCKAAEVCGGASCQ